jgi:heterodisulfide reductase subunit B2
MTATKSATDKSLLKAVQDETGENASLCYFCKKCTAGCPLSDHMDVAPHQVMRSVQLDRKDPVLASKTIWICASCQTCVTRCPQQLDLPRIMDSLKMMAKERGVKSPVPSVSAFNESTMRWIGWTGRSYEPGLIAEMNLRGKHLTKDIGLGLKLIARGKLKLLPDRVRYSPPRKRPEIGPDDSTVAYYPGCSLHSTSKDYEESVHAAMEAVGVKLEEPKGWLCCGSAAAHSTSHLQAAALPMKNLALVRAAGRGRVTTPCPACFSRMKSAVRDVEGNMEFAEQVDRETGYAWDGQVSVENLLDTVVDRIGVDKIAEKVARPLAGLKVVCYYGCLLTRPAQLTGAGEAEYPAKMDRLVRRESGCDQDGAGRGAERSHPTERPGRGSRRRRGCLSPLPRQPRHTSGPDGQGAGQAVRSADHVLHPTHGAGLRYRLVQAGIAEAPGQPDAAARPGAGRGAIALQGTSPGERAGQRDNSGEGNIDGQRIRCPSMLATERRLREPCPQAPRRHRVDPHQVAAAARYQGPQGSYRVQSRCRTGWRPG